MGPLEETEVHKNFSDRYTAPEVLARAMQFAHERDTHLLHLEPGDEWSPETGALNRHLTSQWPLTAEAIARYATLEQRRVKRAIEATRGPRRTVTGLTETIREFFTHDFPASLARADVTLAFGLSTGTESWTVRLSAGRLAALEPAATDLDETLVLSPHELDDVLRGASSWEDVWYGYRLHVKKRAGSGYSRAFWEMLLGVDADLVRARRA